MDRLIERGFTSEETHDQMRTYGFTPTEERVALRLLEAMSNQEMADSLGMGVYTLKDHLVSMYGKAHASDFGNPRVGLVLLLLGRVPARRDG